MGADGLRGDLEALLDAPGWRWLVDHVSTECRLRKDAGLRAALLQANDGVALNELRKVDALGAGVELVLRAPAEKLSQLRSQEQQTATVFDQSRRGPL